MAAGSLGKDQCPGGNHEHQARQVLYEELHQYNYKRVHSTTGEIPVLRYEKALKLQAYMSKRRPDVTATGRLSSGMLA
jgi:hypothetical protein